MNVGERLRIHRAAARLSQRHLAKLTGLSPWTIGEIERGYKRPTHDEQLALGSALVERVGGMIQDIFPSFIPKKQATDGHTAGLARNEPHDDEA